MCNSRLPWTFVKMKEFAAFCPPLPEEWVRLPIAYNDPVGSWTGRSLLFRQGTGEESPNSTEQCAG